MNDKICKCDHPDCYEEIYRGLAHVCGSAVHGGRHGCGLHFCDWHLAYRRSPVALIQLCERCLEGKRPFEPKPDTEVV